MCNNQIKWVEAKANPDQNSIIEKGNQIGRIMEGPHEWQKSGPGRLWEGRLAAGPWGHHSSGPEWWLAMFSDSDAGLLTDLFLTPSMSSTEWDMAALKLPEPPAHTPGTGLGLPRPSMSGWRSPGLFWLDSLHQVLLLPTYPAILTPPCPRLSPRGWADE